MRNLMEYTNEDIEWHESQLQIVGELLLKLSKDKYHHEQMLIILKNRLERTKQKPKN